MDEEMKAIEENRQREKFNSIPDAETYIVQKWRWGNVSWTETFTDKKQAFDCCMKYYYDECAMSLNGISI